MARYYKNGSPAQASHRPATLTFYIRHRTQEAPRVASLSSFVRTELKFGLAESHLDRSIRRADVACGVCGLALWRLRRKEITNGPVDPPLSVADPIHYLGGAYWSPICPATCSMDPACFCAIQFDVRGNKLYLYRCCFHASSLGHPPGLVSAYSGFRFCSTSTDFSSGFGSHPARRNACLRADLSPGHRGRAWADDTF